jgi:polysaccharide export outer membrane protein
LAYALRSGDDIEVKFTYTPELNERQIVRPDGKISLPLIGDVTAAGDTVGHFEDMLRRSYAKELKNPDLLVAVRAFGSNTVYVDGEVPTPGQVTIVWPTTALQAVLQAGGFKDTAYPSEVLLIRAAAAGQPTWQVLDLKKAVNAEDFSDNVLLAPRDIVYVPRTAIGDAGVWVDQYIRRLLPVTPGIGISPTI